MKRSVIVALCFLAACNAPKKETKEEATARVKKGKGFDLFNAVDTLAVKDEKSYIVQYQKYLEIKKQNAALLQEEPAAAFAELEYSSFFVSKETSFMNFENKAYEQLKQQKDSLDKVYSVN
jgi:hypothetical protein